MKVVLASEAIQSISYFQNLTGSSVIDCLEDDIIYFVVAKGQYGLTVGKGGEKIKNAERLFKKPIKVIEYTEDPITFIKNMLPFATDVAVKDNFIEIKIRSNERSKVIGKRGKNIKIINQFLKRLFNIEGLKVK